MLGIDIKLLPLQGATAPTRDTQGVASLALGYVLHWAFSPPLLIKSEIKMSLMSLGGAENSGANQPTELEPSKIKI